MEVPLARAPPGSPKSPLRVPPGSPRSPLRTPPGSPRSDLPPLARLPLPASPSSRPKLFFLLSRVPHWLFAILGFHSTNQTSLCFLLYLPIFLLHHHQFIAFRKGDNVFSLDLPSIPHSFPYQSLHLFYFWISIFLFSLSISSPSIPLSLLLPSL